MKRSTKIALGGMITGLCIMLMFMTGLFPFATYALPAAAGIVLVAVGVSFEVTANVVVLAGEGVVLAICQVCPIKFGTMKVIFDVSLVVIASALSLVFLNRLEGVREGTVAAALFVGTISRQLNKPLGKLGEKILN